MGILLAPKPDRDPARIFRPRGAGYGLDGAAPVRGRSRTARMGIASDSVRLVNAEGDFLPGLVADRYADTIVVSLHVRGMEPLAPRLAECLTGLFPGVSVYLKRDEHHARVEGSGSPPDTSPARATGRTVIQPRGASRQWWISHAARKTGFYLDQRANRTACASVASAAASSTCSRIPELFREGRGSRCGQRRVRRELAARPGAGRGERPAQSRHGAGEVRVGACRRVRSSRRGERFDLIIADPHLRPPAHGCRGQRCAATFTLNQQALRCLSPGGIPLHLLVLGAWTARCSGRCSRRLRCDGSAGAPAARASRRRRPPRRLPDIRGRVPERLDAPCGLASRRALASGRVLAPEAAPRSWKRVR